MTTHRALSLILLLCLAPSLGCEDEPPPPPPPPAPPPPPEPEPVVEEPVEPEPAKLFAIGPERDLTASAFVFRSLFAQRKHVGLTVVASDTPERFWLVGATEETARGVAEALGVEVSEQSALPGAPAVGDEAAQAAPEQGEAAQATGQETGEGPKPTEGEAEEPAEGEAKDEARDEPAVKDEGAAKDEPAAKDEGAARDEAAQAETPQGETGEGETGETTGVEAAEAGEEKERLTFTPMVARSEVEVDLQRTPDAEGEYVRTLPAGTVVVALHGTHGEYTSAADESAWSRVVVTTRDAGWVPSDALSAPAECLPPADAFLTEVPEDRREALASDLVTASVHYRKEGEPVEGALLLIRDPEQKRSYLGVYPITEDCALAEGFVLEHKGVVQNAAIVNLEREGGNSALLLGWHATAEPDKKGRMQWAAFEFGKDRPFWKETLATAMNLDPKDRDRIEVNHTIRVELRSDYYPLRLTKVDKPAQLFVYDKGKFKKAEPPAEDQGPDPGAVSKQLVGMWRDMPELLGTTDGERMWFVQDGTYGWAAPEARSAKPIKANQGDGNFRTGRWGVTQGVLSLVEQQRLVDDTLEPTQPIQVRKLEIGDCERVPGEDTKLTCVTFAGTPFWRYASGSRDAAQAIRDKLNPAK